jgi:non-heme chloroperoxidase
VRIESAQLSNGLRLPFVQQGDPLGVPVVLLHAYVDSWRSFELVLPHLPESIHAYAVTQRGHGDADRPASGYRLEDFSADVSEFMDAVGLEAAVLVGSSSGGFVAQRFAVDHPERTLGLVLIGTPRSLRERPPFLDAVLELTDPIDPAFVRDFAAAIPGSRLIVYEGTGHMVLWEEPERVAADVVSLSTKRSVRGDL